MKKTELVILEFAQTDIIESNNFYNSQATELGNAFKESLDYCFEDILQNTISYPIEFKSVRKFVMNVFPFNIYEENIVYILAVFHQKRNPYIWKKRVLK